MKLFNTIARRRSEVHSRIAAWCRLAHVQFASIQIAQDIIFIGLPIVAIIILMSYPHRAYRDLDGLAMQLTGDPYALIAIQHLIAALNGFKFDRPQRFSPSAAKRIEALIKLSKSTEAHASYAADPIPAILHITVNGALISVPLNQATLPTPALN